MRAVYSIASWRDNRSAQESCLSLNQALRECLKFGKKPIDTYDEFSEFFHELVPILRVTSLDDPVTSAFGEIMLRFGNQFYPIIAGTGHTGSVYCKSRNCK